MRDFEADVRSLYSKITKALISKGLTLATMESATGGQIVSLLTDTEGASAVIRGGAVTYINEIKLRFGISEKTLNEFSVYSNEVSHEMALRSREIFGTDIGIGVTGTTGNIDPANAEHSVPGKVYFSISVLDTVKDFSISLEPQPCRLDYKLRIAQHIGNALLDMLPD